MRTTACAREDTWISATCTFEYKECLGTQLLYNLMHIEPSFLDAAPFFDRTALLGDGFDDESLIQCAIYIVQCITELVTMLDKYHEPKFRILINSHLSRLAKYNIYPSSFAKVAQALLMTMSDVMQEEFTKKVESHWISILIILFRFFEEPIPDNSSVNMIGLIDVKY